MAKTDSNIPAVAYYRMSSDSQEASIPAQRDAVEQYAKDNGYKLIGEYADEGISGDATNKRLQFQKMLSDATGGNFKAILCWDIDRFGRFDSLEGGYWIHPLREAGVHLATVAQGPIDWNDFTSRMMYSFHQESKHEFLRGHSRNVLRGKHAAANLGYWMGKPPFGYVIKDKKLALGDPHDVQLVRDIFEWYLTGDSLRAITRRLKEQGELTHEGRPWTPSRVQRTLSRVTYTGDYIWNARHRGKYHAVCDGKVVPASDRTIGDDSIVHRDNHPAIIDRATYDAVQMRLFERKGCTTPHRNGGDFVLTGLIRCGKCGGRMFGESAKGHKSLTYICYTGTQCGDCDRNPAPQDVVLQQVGAAMKDRFGDAKVAERLRAELTKQANQASATLDAPALKRQLAKVETDLAQAKRRLVEVDSDLVGVVQDRIRELTTTRDALNATLRTAETPLTTIEADINARVDQAMCQYNRLPEAIQEADPVRLRELLSQTLDKVVVWSHQPGPRRHFKLKRGVIHLRGDHFHNLSPPLERTPRAFPAEYST